MGTGLIAVHRVRSRVAVLAVAIVAVASALVGVQSSTPAPASALSGSSFDPGNIISDAEFYNGGAMSEGQIQAFLDAQVGTCTNGQCLNVLVTSTASRARIVSDTTHNVRCEAFDGGTLSAAEIIYRAQVACGISARVILVTLQKEQGLVTATAPSQAALDRAMGFACPDTAPCAASSLGFGNQVYTGALQLKTYKASNFGVQPGLSSVLYSPNASCGSSVVNIQDYATAALYNYTPYQPDSAALANLNGVGDACSSYGNRNFWVYYNNWFGGPVTPQPLAAGENLFVYDRDSAGNLWLESGDGHGGWKSRVQIGTGWGSMTAILGAEDFSGDGHQDVIARDSSGNLRLYRGDGTGAVGSSTILGTGWQGLMVMGAGDFNGDGRQDIFARDGLGNLWLYPGDGKGGFLPKVLAGTGWNGMPLLGSGDFNGDGFEDLYVLDGNGVPWIYLGNGKGGWLPRVSPGAAWNGINAVVGVGDFDGDGKTDVLARDTSGVLWLYPGNGSGGWNTRVQVGAGWGTLQIGGTGDLDGDPPVVTRTAPVAGESLYSFGVDASGALTTFPGNGSGGYGTPIPSGTGFGTYQKLMRVGDFNNDGHQDLLGIDAAGVLWLIPGAGGGAFGPPVQVATGFGGMDAVIAAGDFNGDSHPDILARDAATASFYLYPGDGVGGLGPRVLVGTGWNGMTILAGGDFSGDGKQDVFARDGLGNLWLYLGDGRGGWLTKKLVGTGWTGMGILASGDFNGDGNQDILTRDGNGVLFLYPGNGKSGWSPRVPAPAGFSTLTWVG